MNSSEELEWRLQGLYDEFLELNDINGSADELLMEEGLDEKQRQFLSGFVLIWEAVHE